METLNTNLKNLSKNKVYLILIGLAVIILATVLIYAYVEYSGTKISVIPTEEGKPYCGAIGSRSEGWYIDSGFNRPELIRWDKCKGCSAICKAIGSRSEGWYSSCDNRLIKWDNCGEGHEEGNLPPVIDGLTAPTRLQVNEKGVWTIKARDPENGSLSYSVRWGLPSIAAATAELDKKSQTTTFTHSYAQAGIYTIDFIITDNYQQTAEASTTIEVVSKISEATCTDSDGGINKYVKGKTCREIHYNSSAAVSCKTDMCDGLCYSQSTSTNLDGKESNIISSSHGDPTSTNLKKDHKTPSLPPYYKDFSPIEPPIPNNLINSESPFVKEYYCEGDRIFSKFIHCESGCKDGACLKEKQTCDAKCKSLNYKSGICRTWPVVPDVEWGCKENEKDIGKTSDCTLVRTIGGIDEVIVGVGKTCCCKIECNEKLNKEDCESFGGEYICAVGGTETICYCECPCKTNDDCNRNRCGLGRSAKSDYPYWCIEHRDNCEDGKCVYTQKEYKNRTCGGIGGIQCVDACGDGVCQGSEAAWCPEDCKEETGSITITSPNGDEQWIKGSAYNITWSLEPEIDFNDKFNDKVAVYLVDESQNGACTENGACCYTCTNWKLIASGIPASFGKYGWEISADQKIGAKYKILIRTISSDCFAGCVNDISDNYFSIIDEGIGECTDTDHGRDYYKKGSVSKCYNGTCTIPMQDFCILFDMAPNSTYSGKAINEYYCDGSEIKSEKFECPNGCEDGACIKGDEPYCSAIGSYSEGWYQNGQRITWENCDGCHAVCKEVGTKSEGWYSSGSCETAGKLIKYDNCAEDVSCRDENYECTVEDIPCCSGLKEVLHTYVGPDGNCVAAVPCGSICRPCGNGICDANENKCNCPEDCIKEEKLSADLNCDEKVNLVDMAILLSWWGKDPSEATSCKNPDINQDGKINLVDFSIMMSQWTTL